MRWSGCCRRGCFVRSVAEHRPAIIINPMSGAAARRGDDRLKAEMAVAQLQARGLVGEVFVTEHQGHARELASGAVRRGATVVVAWGGDGTMNEVASALIGTQTVLALIPNGSGNGLARELGVPLRTEAAWALAFEGRDRRIDTATLDSIPFVNVAGIGLDARVAHRFAAGGHRRRGLLGYIDAAVRELMIPETDVRTLRTPDAVLTGCYVMVALANSRQYGNGAVVAPEARLDDGLLDVVAIDARSVAALAWQARRLFTGTLAQAPGVHALQVSWLEVEGETPMVCHVDGEPLPGRRRARVRVLPASLSVRGAVNH